MGKMKSISDVLKSLDKSDKISSEIKELMETLYLLAEQKADIFLMEIKDSINKIEDKKLPVTVLIDEEKTINAYAENGVKNLEEIVSNLLSLIIKHKKEDVVDKLIKSINTVLESFFGSSIAKSDEMEKYYVLIDGYSAIRIDIKCWFHSVESKSLYQHCEKIACIVMTKSVVDLSKIDISTFMFFYQEQLISTGITGKDLEQELENVRRIYDKFKQSMSD